MSQPAFTCAPSTVSHSARSRPVGRFHCLRHQFRPRRPRFKRCTSCSTSPDDAYIANRADLIADDEAADNSLNNADATTMGIAVSVKPIAGSGDVPMSPGEAHDYTLINFLRHIVYPAGFPASVGTGYVSFAVCNVLRQVFRNAYYVLGTSSLLVALSVDTGTSLTLSSALTWALKDGLGLCAKAGVSSTIGPSADADPKRARLAGEFLMVLAGAAEACSVLRPSAFLPLAALAGVLRQAGDSLSGPGYRVFLDTLAVSRNVGDVSARAEAQVVTGKLIGLGLGAVVVAGLASIPTASARLSATGIAFAILSTSHLATARTQVSTVPLPTLNAQRLHLVLDTFLATARVPSVNDVNYRERVVYYSRIAPHPGARAIRFGIGLETVFVDRDARVPIDARYVLGRTGSHISVALREDAHGEDLLLAALHARRLLQIHDNVESDLEAVDMSGKWAQEIFSEFRCQLETQGWDLSRLLFPVGETRYRIEGAHAERNTPAR